MKIKLKIEDYETAQIIQAILLFKGLRHTDGTNELKLVKDKYYIINFDIMRLILTNDYKIYNRFDYTEFDTEKFMQVFGNLFFTEGFKKKYNFERKSKK